MIGSHLHRKFFKQKGFTLTELLVAVAVFSLAITAASSLFSAAAKAQRKSLELQHVLGNGRYVIETVAKSLRMGEIKTPNTGEAPVQTLTICHPTKGTPGYGGCDCSTSPAGNRCLVYTLTSNQVTENGIAISSINVKVTRIYFKVYGVGLANNIQPRVVMTLEVKSRDTIPSAYQAKADFQTTLSQRVLDTP